MTTSARDLTYGRRGGGWADEAEQPDLVGKPCAECGKPMLCGQRGVHFTCCAATGGRLPVCAPHALKKRDGGGKVCGVCWKAAE